MLRTRRRIPDSTALPMGRRGPATDHPSIRVQTAAAQIRQPGRRSAVATGQALALLTGVIDFMSQHIAFAGAVQALLSFLLISGSACRASAQAGNGGATNLASQILEVSGKVEFARVGADDWRPAQAGQPLQPGDRLRTSDDSRATLRLSDKSVIRINQLSVVEIQPPTSATARRRFKLLRGSLFFLNRERPSDIEFETPLATGAIRGTEFLLTVAEADGTTLLVLSDGAVELRSGAETLALGGAQQALLRSGQPAVVAAAPPIVNLIQWCFYYPGALNPAELTFTDNEKAVLANSLAAYRAGDKLEALALAPVNSGAGSDAVRVYFAALTLAVGQVEASEALLAPLPPHSPFASSLRGVIAAVKYQEWTPSRSPELSSEWLALSYYQQSRSELADALTSAKQAAKIAPEFGFAWARAAELEFGFGHHRAARQALAEARRLSPRHAQALTLEGFIQLERNHPTAALDWFNQAIAIDGALGSAWLGRALAQEDLGHAEEGRLDLQAAAALEPHLALFRSYLGKSWSQAGDDALAEKDFALAKRLDPADPTAWLYSALHLHRTHRLNDAVRDLQYSVELNDNRIVFRSRLLLDHDRAVRSANLAALYDGVGLNEVSERAASRAVQDDYANFSGHLFLAQSLQAREDPARFDLRLETPRLSELLVANLLAPAGSGNLSLLLSQQDHLEYFAPRPVGFSALTEYRSRGDWLGAASVFGSVDGFSYALDEQYTSLNGQDSTRGLERVGFSFQAKQQLTAQDSIYARVGYLRTSSGDVAQHYDPMMTSPGLRAREVQEPYLFAGYHREWAPGSHTLFLVARLSDRLELRDPQANVLFIRRSGGTIADVQPDPFFSLNFGSDFTLYSAELQHIWESPRHAVIVGGRYQTGTVETDAVLSRGPSGVVTDESVESGLERGNAYAYYYWRPFEPLRLTAGLSYDWIEFPRNTELPPLTPGEKTRSQLSPKVGLTVESWRNGYWRAAWTRSLGGLYFDNSVRLEPAEVAGFISAYRSLIPESSAGLVPGTEFETWSLGFDQRLEQGTYFGVAAELLQSDGTRALGAFTNSTFLPIPDSPTSTRQTLDFEEGTVSAYASQLLGKYWAGGGRYRLSEARLTGRFPDLPPRPGVAALAQEERSVLGQLRLYLLFNHESGFFAQWYSDWYNQSNHGYTPDRPGDNFWQHGVFVGYRFPRRHAEIRLGLLNLTDQDYRLNPLNLHPDLARNRTFVTTLRLNF